MNKKLNKKTILLIAFITSLFIHGIYLKIVEFNEYLKEKNQRIYTGQYKEKIKDKYPEEFAKGEQYRQKILKSIKSEKKSKNDNVITIEYFDEKGRVVYKVVQSIKTTVVSIGSTKGTNTHAIEVFPAEEEGYIYNDKDQIIKKILVPKQMPYTVKSFDEDNFYTYLKNGGNRFLLYDIKYLSENERIEIEEFCSDLSWTQLYTKVEKKFVNNKLVYEKEFEDQELEDSFIMVNIEKKYNEKGELIYKTVERKDKTNDYKSFTEMDFIKDEIVTKYYKGNEVFATVTENLVGPVETIEEIEMIGGEEVKKVYKNKVKAIVKRQKVGEPVRIVDIQTYDSKELKKNVERYIFDNNGNLNYTVQGAPFNKLSYISSDTKNYPYSMEDGYLHESFYSANIERDNLYKYFYHSKNLKKIDINTNNIEFFEDNEEEDTNISFGIIDITKFKLIKKEQLKEKNITLEELLNGCKYE